VARSFIRTRAPKHHDRPMTVILSTAGLEHVIYPLDTALGGAVLGMNDSQPHPP
jgi:hypothetical protein